MEEEIKWIVGDCRSREKFVCYVQRICKKMHRWIYKQNATTDLWTKCTVQLISYRTYNLTQYPTTYENILSFSIFQSLSLSLSPSLTLHLSVSSLIFYSILSLPLLFHHFSPSSISSFLSSLQFHHFSPLIYFTISLSLLTNLSTIRIKHTTNQP